MKKLNNEIKLKENLENMKRKNNTFSIDLQNTFTGTSTIGGGTTKGPRFNDSQGIRTERRFENGNHGVQNITKKLEKSCLRLQHTHKEMEDCSFLVAERAQRKGIAVLSPFHTFTEHLVGSTTD